MGTESADTTASTLAQGYRNRSRSTRQRGLILSGMLLGFALRLYQLGAESLWYDETVSVYLALLSIPDLIAHTARDIHPPGYYLLLHVWQSLTQPTLRHGLEFLYAWPSLVAGMLLLPLIYALGRKLFDPSLALLALWIAALNPFHLWYSQEVRMYTLGAALGMLCLWAVVMWWRTAEDGGRKTKDHTAEDSGRRITPSGYLILYVIAAAAGLYTLYYFAFLLIALNLWIAGAVISNQLSVISDQWSLPDPQSPVPSHQSPVPSHQSPVPNHQSPVTNHQSPVTNHQSPVPGPRSPVPGPRSPVPNPLPWTLAQVAVILLWLPWLPIFWRQVTEPPVPPWRGTVDGLTVLQETLAAALVGQTPPLGQDLLWAGIALMVLIAALFAYANSRRQWAIAGLMIYSFVPLLLIYRLSVWVTPLYHVRYFFTYAAPLPLLLALGLRMLTRGRRPLLAGGVSLIFAVSLWSLSEFWTDPRYRADDHRAAVADLAASWRPGDAILVNAGWAYPILDVYWPQALDSATDSLPPILAQRTRLLDYTNIMDLNAPILVTTGSVDGSATLGWGLAESDFFRMERAEAQTALARLIEEHPRLWHYRLYDTVSDPAGDLRALLEEQAALLREQAYPGRDYLRVQLYETESAVDPQFCPHADDRIDFGGALRLTSAQTTTTIRAGSILYATLCWEALASVDAFPAGLRTSLRLYQNRPDGETLVAQADTAPLPSTTTWTPGSLYRQPLALPISAALPPGSYDLAMIVYNGGNGDPLPPDDPAAVDGQRWGLGTVEIELPPSPPMVGGSLARFDYIDLLSATIPETASPSAILNVKTVWRPRPNDYQDSYAVIYFLTGERTSQLWMSKLGGAEYPSGDWSAGFPVQQAERLALAADLPPGDYQLSVRLERASDRLPIPARSRLAWWAQEQFPIGVIAVR